jgi:regulator of sirC expression with transglutaminase-like and TPR domain
VSEASRARLAEVLRGPDPDLAEANLLVAAEARPGLDLPAQLARVDALADEARRRGEGADGVVEALRAAGLRGDRDDYDDPRNSFLDAVLDRRRGLPIALATLTLAVARRAGAPMSGIGMPGHFVVADDSGPAPRYLDPFDGWPPLSLEECARLVERTAGVPFEPAFLRPVGPRGIVGRTLANLRAAYARRRRLGDMLWTVELGLVVSPGDEALARERGGLLAAVGRYDDAEASAARYLAERPGSPHRAAVQAQLDAVRDMRRRMN